MFDDLIADLKKGLDEFNDNKEDCMNNIAITLKSNTQKNTPVSTGKLKKSYDTKVTKDEAMLDNTADYYDYVNDGHSAKGSGFVAGKHMTEKGLASMPVSVTKEVQELLNKTKLF